MRLITESYTVPGHERIRPGHVVSIALLISMTAGCVLDQQVDLDEQPAPSVGVMDHITWNGEQLQVRGINYAWYKCGIDFGRNAWGYNGVAATAADGYTRPNYDAVEADFQLMHDMGSTSSAGSCLTVVRA